MSVVLSSGNMQMHTFQSFGNYLRDIVDMLSSFIPQYFVVHSLTLQYFGKIIRPHGISGYILSSLPAQVSSAIHSCSFLIYDRTAGNGIEYLPDLFPSCELL